MHAQAAGSGLRAAPGHIRPVTPYSPSPRHPAYSRPGTVLNLDEVREAKIIPPSFLKDGEHWVEGTGWSGTATTRGPYRATTWPTGP